MAGREAEAVGVDAGRGVWLGVGTLEHQMFAHSLDWLEGM